MKKIFLLIPALFLLELIFGESGNWVGVGGISVRKLLFILSLLSLYGYAVVSRERLKFSKIDLAVLFFVLVNTVWGVLVPTLYGRSLVPAFADFGATYILLLYFPLIGLLRAEVISWKSVKYVFFALVSLFALAHLTLWITVTAQPSLMGGVRGFFLEFFQSPSIFVGPMPGGFARIMLVTSIFLLPAFFVLSYALVKGYWRLAAAPLLFVVSVALVVSYTRSFWFGVAFGLLLAIVGIFLKSRRGASFPRAFKLGAELSPAMVFAAAFIFVGVAGAVLEPAPREPSEPSSGNNAPQTPASPTGRAASTFDTDSRANSVKIQQLSHLIEGWRNAPLFGKGFGGYVEGHPRSEAAPFSYELTGPSLLMKLGIVGLTLWLLPLVYIAAAALYSTKNGADFDRIRFAAAGFAGFGLAVQTNPLLINFVGMTIVLFYMLEFGTTYGGNYATKFLGEKVSSSRLVKAYASHGKSG